MNETTSPQTPTRDSVTSSDLVGSRVEITRGAWKGENGTVRDYIPQCDGYRVTLDSGIQLAWAACELRKLPTEKLCHGVAERKL